MSNISLPPDRHTADKAELERFVTDNDDLLELESLIGRFNIFDALDIARVEIRHSTFLGFILSPSESHGLGQLFLRALLIDILKSTPQHLRPLSPVDLDGADLRGVEVRREWQRIDLFIKVEEPEFIVVIENKVDSGEHTNQLARYERGVESAYPLVKKLFVFLTPGGDEPSGERWISYKYADLYKVLQRTAKTYRGGIGPDVQVFLDHYLSLIGTRFMDDATIDDLCRRIYVNHRRALELIYERGGSAGYAIAEQVEAALRADARVHVFQRVGRQVDFVPADWLSWLPELGADRPEARAWLIQRFEVNGQRLDYYVEVRQMQDREQRRRIVDILLNHSEELGFRQRGRTVAITNSYTRVSGREPIVSWKEREEPEADAIRLAAKSKLDSVLPKLGRIGDLLTAILHGPPAPGPGDA